MQGVALLLALFGIFRRCLGSTVYGCDLVGLNICAWDLSQNISKVTSENVYVIPSARDVKELCKYNTLFEHCYKDKLSGCANNIMYISSFAATKRTMEFICLEAYDNIILHNDCWIQDYVHKATHMCYHEHLRQIQKNLKRLREPQGSFTDSAWCRMVSNSKSCMHGVISERCSSSAVAVVDRMMDTVLEDIINYMGCQYQGGLVRRSKQQLKFTVETRRDLKCFRLIRIVSNGKGGYAALSSESFGRGNPLRNTHHCDTENSAIVLFDGRLNGYMIIFTVTLTYMLYFVL